MIIFPIILQTIITAEILSVERDGKRHINPFNASCSKLLLFEWFSAILV